MDTRLQKQPQMTVMEIFPEQQNKQIANFPESNIADLVTDYHGPSPYHLNYCGTEKCAPGFQFGPKKRRSYLIHMVTEGRGTYTVGSRTYSVGPGQVFLIYPGDTTIYQADQDDPWTYFWTGFSGYRAEFICSQIGFSRTSHVISVRDTDPLRECVESMLQTHKITLANDLNREALLLRFLALLIQESSSDSRENLVHPKSVYSKMALEYMANHYAEKITISDIADYVGVDRSHLGKCFQAEYHMSPKEYLMKIRMQNAAELLSHTDRPVSVIASECGYPDALAFAKMFRKYYDCSPTAFREAAHTR